MSSQRATARSIGLACGVLLAGTTPSVGGQFLRESCFLPPDPGPCLCYSPRYHYHATTGRCEVFIYGCCEGNENNFLTLADCEAACVPTAEDCQLPFDVGSCDGICPRFFYNAETGQCEPFEFGCCDENANNFLTQEACEATCPDGLAQLASIPAVSEWGIVAMTLIVLSVGTVALMRRRVA